MKVDIFGCARCGLDHKHVEVKKFTKQSVHCDEDTHYNFFAICPDLREPVLLDIKIDTDCDDAIVSDE